MENVAIKRTIENASGRQRPLARIWQHRWWSLILTIGATLLLGVLIALAMPRGPATAVEALLVLVSSLAVGLLAGLLLRSRWAMLLAPLAYIIAIELARLDAVGPTVDAIRLDNTFSILALILGRGFHGIVGLLPMILGVEVGVQVARRLDGSTPTGGRMRTVIRWLPTAVLAILVIALALLIAQPASTPPILGADGEPLPGSIAELTMVDINGRPNGLMIRGYDVNKPVLLYLSGGPGQSSLPWPRVLFDDLSRDFILVGWDQRGTGKSYAALDPDETLTPEQMVADTIAVTDYLRQRFDEDKIYLLGESWGTTLAVLAAQERPDLYYALIGSGQMVSQSETDRLLYYDVLEYATQTGDEELAAQMRTFGEPPYSDIYGYAFVMGQYEKLYKPYTPPQAFLKKGRAANLGPWNVLGSEYNFVEKVNVFRGFLDTAAILYPQLQGLDFRQDVPRLDVPLYVLDGEAELSARRDLALEWFEQLDAPIKRIYTFENSAHAPAFEHFAAFTDIMTGTVLPETYTR